jgi:hypothetical protein
MIVVIAIIVSLFKIESSSKTGISVTFGASNITAILLAIMWLPTLLRVLALVGGGVKTSVGEATTSGLLSQIIATFDTIESKLPDEDQRHVQEIRHTAEVELASQLPSSEASFQLEINSLAREYESIRKNMTSGYRRTQKMGEILAQARALASRAQFSSREIRRVFEADTDGNRLVAIGFIQALLSVDCFDIVLLAIRKPRSPFEQYHALRAAESMLPLLSNDLKKQLRDTLEYQRSGEEGTWINPQTAHDRWQLSGSILEKIGANLNVVMGQSSR